MPAADEQALAPWLMWSGLGALLSEAQLALLALPPFNVATATDLSALTTENLKQLGLKQIPAAKRAAVLASMKSYLRAPKPAASELALGPWLAWAGLGHLDAAQVAEALGAESAPDLAWADDLSALELDAAALEKIVALVAEMKLLHGAQ